TAGERDAIERIFLWRWGRPGSPTAAHIEFAVRPQRQPIDRAQKSFEERPDRTLPLSVDFLEADAQHHAILEIPHQHLALERPQTRVRNPHETTGGRSERAREPKRRRLKSFGLAVLG